MLGSWSLVLFCGLPRRMCCCSPSCSEVCRPRNGLILIWVLYAFCTGDLIHLPGSGSMFLLVPDNLAEYLRDMLSNIKHTDVTRNMQFIFVCAFSISTLSLKWIKSYLSYTSISFLFTRKSIETNCWLTQDWCSPIKPETTLPHQSKKPKKLKKQTPSFPKLLRWLAQPEVYLLPTVGKRACLCSGIATQWFGMARCSCPRRIFGRGARRHTS